jgi:hypothetical protein
MRTFTRTRELSIGRIVFGVFGGVSVGSTLSVSGARKYYRGCLIDLKLSASGLWALQSFLPPYDLNPRNAGYC